MQLYGGRFECELVKTGRGRHYLVNGEKYISVTEALGIIDKPALKFWAVKKCIEYLVALLDETGRGIITQNDLDQAKRAHTVFTRDAANIGTAVHKWVENYIKTKDETLPSDENVMNGVLAFLRWRDAHRVDFISSERMICSPTHGFIGTMDAEAIIDDKLSVIDFKTSSGIWIEHRLQTAAYQKAAEEEGTKYDGDRWIVRFDKLTAEFEAKQFGDVEEDFKAFINALQLKKRLKVLESLK